MESLKAELATKTAMISHLETQNEMLQGSSSSVDQSDLVAACESDKVAASRAMKQNKQLKEQLEELQMAIIKLVIKIKFYMISMF